MENEARRKEIIKACMETFINKGLGETSVRDLCASIKSSSSSGLYYWFSDKEQIVVACAEEALLCIEEVLIFPFFDKDNNLNSLLLQLQNKAKMLASTMKFFVQVCSTEKYRIYMKPTLDNFYERCNLYIDRYAHRLHIHRDVIEPYFHVCISAVTNYMLFGDERFFNLQIEFIISELKRKLG